MIKKLTRKGERKKRDRKKIRKEGGE